MNRVLMSLFNTFFPIRFGSGIPAIPFKIARLCVNCEHVIKDPACPICGSKTNLVLGNVLGINNC
jgi:rRNA maturation endonuclease Nob1